MNTDNDFIKHIVNTKKNVDNWPEWKRNLLGGDDLSSKSIKALGKSTLAQSNKKK